MYQLTSLLKLVMIASIVRLQGKMTPLSTSIGREGWWSCGEEGPCISTAQVCDGQHDCDGGGDESDDTCANWGEV
jgi:hypothetical protein